MNKIDKLEIKIVSDTDLEWRREFNAPIDLVFKAHSQPELIKRWLHGPPGFQMIFCEVDFRAGGSYKYIWQNEQQVEMVSNGTFKEIVIPEKIVSMEFFSNSKYNRTATGTLILYEMNGKTILHNRLTYESKEDRDQVLQSQIVACYISDYSKLDELLL